MNKRAIRVISDDRIGFIQYAVLDPENRLVPVTVHHSMKRLTLHHPELDGSSLEIMTQSEFIEARKEVDEEWMD